MKGSPQKQKEEQLQARLITPQKHQKLFLHNTEK